LRHFWYFIQCLRLSRRADIIFAQDPISAGLPALLAAKILNRKFFIRVAGDYAWEQSVNRFGVRDSIDDFQKLLSHSEFREFMFTLFSSRVFDLMQLNNDVTFKKLDQRLAKYLIQQGPNCLELL